MGSCVSQTVSLKVLNSLPYRGTRSLSWFFPLFKSAFAYAAPSPGSSL